MNGPDAVDERPLVLVVDDAPEYLQMLGEALDRSCRVRVANSGRRALQMAAQEPVPDLVLLDVLMPDMDGREVLAALRENPRTRRIPAIFVTSLDGAGDELAGLSLGAADYIAKPAPPAIVEARVRTQIELSRTRERLQRQNLALQAEIESRIRLEQSLKEALAGLEAFSYTVSHDLRAPLAAIHGFAGALMQTEAGALSPKGRHRLERIVAGSRRMEIMIDDILKFSRAERSPMERGRVDLQALLAELLADLPDGGSAVSVGVLPAVSGDAAMLRQVFANLLGNAVKFSARVAQPRVEVSAHAAGGRVRIDVTDNGAGFDPAAAHRLFGLFQRLHADAEFPGTGVGLAIVRRLVERLGGSVAAESVPGVRTTFSVTLPSDSA